jgi:hypothetical protein
MKLTEMNLTPEQKQMLLEELLAERVALSAESLVRLMSITSSLNKVAKSLSALTLTNALLAIETVKPEIEAVFCILKKQSDEGN